jgi:pteridine reductase
VLVVGGSGQLGVAIARGLSRRGDDVLLSARDDQKLAGIVDELRTVGPGRHHHICVDLRERDAHHRIVEGVEAWGGVEDVVLACGPFPRTPLDELTREDLENTLLIHAVAPLLIVSALSPQLIEANGAVVALGDAGVTRPYTNHVAYITAKGALQTGLRALSVELAPHVRVNVLALGVVADEEADADPLRTHRLKARSPLGRFGTASEVVHATLSLLDASWATGEVWGIGR